jgi:hypothetical protein
MKNLLTHMHRLEYNSSNQVKRLPKGFTGAEQPPDRRSTVFGGFMNTRFLARLKFAGAALLLLASVSAQAQFRASIQGTVTDPDGAVIPGAQLSLKDNGTNHVITATSDSAGIYNFGALPADHFTLTTSAPGFRQKVIENLQIIPEQANSVDVKLDLGEASTSVTVSGEAQSAVDTETANIGGTVNSNDIQHLPSFNRDVFTLTQLAPGTISDGSQGSGGGVYNLPGNQGPGGSGNNNVPTENGPQANANGGQYETNSIAIDGISTVSAVWGGTTIITPTEDSVDNVRIVTNAYDAEDGRFSGAQTLVTSKSGTNQVHGSLFFALHRPGLNAFQRYNGPAFYNSGKPAARGLQRDEQRFNQYGGSVGGPIWKDHAFAFFAYEAIRNNSTSTGSGWFDTAAFDALAPTGSIAAKYLSFPGNAPANTGIIAQTCANIGLTEGVNCRTVTGGLNIGSPLTTGLGKQDLGYVSNTIPGVGGGLSTVADIADYSTASPSSYAYTQYNGRLDADVTKKDHAAFAIYWVPQNSQFYNGQRTYNLFNHNQINEALSAIWNRTFSPNLLNELRANAAGWRWNEIGSNPQQPVGLPQSNINGIGNIGVNNFGANLGSDLDQWTYTYKDVATAVIRSHTIKFGAEVTMLHYLNNPAGIPGYNFYNIWDFLNDAPKEEFGNFNSVTGVPGGLRQDDRETLLGFFVQDQWKVAPTLTINAGLRYSYLGPLHSNQNNLNTVVFGSGSTLLTGLSVRQGGNLWMSQKSNIGPQVGFNWSPGTTGKMVVRGGFGMSFNQEEIAISANAGNNPKIANFYDFNSGSPTSINPKISYGISSSPTALYGYAANPNAVTSYNSSNLPTGGSASVYSFGSPSGTLPTQYSLHYSLEASYQLPYQMVASLGYEGSTGRHELRHFNENAVAAATGITLNPLVTNVEVWGNDGNSNNNAMLAELKHQFSHHFSADAQFQWARSMDDDSGPYTTDPYPYQRFFARGRSDFDVSKSFKLYGLWQPVLFHGNYGWMEKVAGGWSLSGIMNIHTGFGWTPNYNNGQQLYCNCSGPTYYNQRPYYKGGAGKSHSNDAYKSGPGVGNGVNQNFPGQANVVGPAGGVTSWSGSPYFYEPNYASGLAGNSFPGASPGLPPPPGTGRNSFTGPGYRDVDASLTKAFGLPKLPVLGEDAKFEIRADAFNLFNLLNLNSGSINNNVTQTGLGQAGSALGARTVSFQARFSF